MVNNDSTRRVHWWHRGIGLAGTAILTVGVFGAVHTDKPSHLNVLTTTPDLVAAAGPTDLLASAVANFTDANQALHNIDTTVHPAFASFIDSQISTQSLVMQSILGLEHAEDTISANSAPFGFLVDGFFTLFNLGWNLNSEAMLALAQGMENALTSNLSGIAAMAEIGLYVLDFQAFGGSFAEFPILFASAFF